MNLIRNYMKTTLEEVWSQARSKHLSANLDTDDHDAVVYRGVKVVRDVDGIRLYCTDKDFYEEITDKFVGKTFDEGLENHLKFKYINKLNLIEESIQEELNGNKNHKRFSYLKSMRKFYLNKYNEINT